MKTMAETNISDRNVEKPSTSSEPQKPRGTKREDSLSVVGVELIDSMATNPFVDRVFKAAITMVLFLVLSGVLWCVSKIQTSFSDLLEQIAVTVFILTLVVFAVSGLVFMCSILLISTNDRQTTTEVKNNINNNIGDNNAVIITGCDTGFGNGLAFELNALGFYTIALCLDAKGDGVKQLTNKAIFANKFITLELDITQESQIDKTFDEISHLLRDNGLKLWALVNNAGIFDAGYVEWGNGVEAYQRLLDVNTLGTIRMTRKYLPLLRETGGRVVNVLSVAARLAIDGYSAYCVSKHASLA
ncbi:unnamed protein product, partial [Oppiella nova]